MLSEIRQTEEENTVCYHLYMDSKKYNKLVNIIKKKHTYRYREPTRGYQWGEEREEGQDRGRGVRGTAIRYEIRYQDILYNMGNIATIL